MSQAAVPPLPSGRFGEPLLELGEHARREPTRPERNMTHVQTEIPKHRNLTAPGALTFPVGRLHRVEVARMVMAKNHLEHPTQLARAKHLDCPLGPRKKWKFRATPDRGAQGITGEVFNRIDGIHHPQIIAEIHVFKGCFWNETCWPQARARHEVPRTSLRCHLHIALPCLHLILRKQPAFANNVAFDTRLVHRVRPAGAVHSLSAEPASPFNSINGHQVYELNEGLVNWAWCL